jgi:methionyl-tRNA formyltransferase
MNNELQTTIMNEVKALILCNNPIAVPGIKEFLFFGKVGVIGIPKRNKEMKDILDQMMADSGVPLLLLDKNDYKEKITQAIQQNQVTVGLMMTFPFIIPPEILSLPANGFINFHYGLLPQCRGPHPILWHLLNNDTEAGVTIHKVDEGIDTGPVIIQEKIPVEDNDTYGTLQSKLAFLAAKQAANLLKILSYGTIIPAVAQDESKAAYYEMPTAAALTINWQKMDAEKIVRLVNACNPWNKGAGTTINNWGIGITETEIIGECEITDASPGKILACNKEAGLIVSTMDNKKLKINIIYTNEGFFLGSRLAVFQIKAGDWFM